MDGGKIMLVLCGSIASFMIKQVIHSKALYGRIDLELLIKELSPAESYRHLTTNYRARFGLDEFLRFYLIMGGIPKYYSFLDSRISPVQNIENLFFKNTGFFFNEPGKIFYSQFKEAITYEKIVKAIQLRIQSSDELARSLKIPSGGRFSRYLDILEKARFIKGYSLFGKASGGKKIQALR
ncbi:MAG: hypothetical protein A2583_14675 [Bdellovibrionales bacterium RIFOXYD1_FULL_53_11]|nr:MAG: hypothetical protein A2583_14675 [Bdellovibrionales bacterium RIFOXYD1_FULL_53_11]